MISENRKVVLIGTGMVGMSYAYALLNQNVCDELVLVDLDRKRAEGEAMDLNHGLAFSGSNMKIYAGGYEDAAMRISSPSARASPRSRENPGSICSSGIRRFLNRSWILLQNRASTGFSWWRPIRLIS